MRLLDRIALERAVTLFLNFILAVLKLIIPKASEDTKKPRDERKKWFPRWRKNK